MELFDSHAHYDDRKFKGDVYEVITAAYKSGVKYILNAGSDISTSIRSVKLAEEFDFVFAAVGVHPHEVGKLKEDDLEEIEELCGNPKAVAVGEIGLDYYYDHSPRDLQKEWFQRQLDLAKNFNLPVIIHNREAHEDTMKILRQGAPFKAEGVLHCFSGSREMAKELMQLGFYISFGGSITFKNARKTVEVLENMPMDRILVETDCPYLTPEPFRGRRNDSSYVKLVAEKIAEIKGLTLEEVAKVTTENAKRLFRI